jgi:hypothetical protein
VQIESTNLNAQVYAEQYATLTDSELIVLQGQRESLFPVAIDALDTELRKRGIGKEHLESPVIDNDEKQPNGLPYRWGRFEGGFIMVSSFLGGAAGLLIQRDIVGAIVSGLVCYLGFGIYEKRKWAVMIFEAITVLSLLVIGFLLFASHSPEAVGVFLFLLLGSAPQTYYFWKRRNELR